MHIHRLACPGVRSASAGCVTNHAGRSEHRRAAACRPFYRKAAKRTKHTAAKAVPHAVHVGFMPFGCAQRVAHEIVKGIVLGRARLAQDSNSKLVE
jgi:hypothetical protein